jgi:hypothetical protein
MNDRANSKERSLKLSHEEAVRDLEPIRQNVTKQMVLFSLFIGLIGWVFNFDLGEPKGDV